MLYVVSTPIGNLKDISLRAIETLKRASLIAAEDTRHTRILCREFDIQTPLLSYYEHNKIQRGKELLKRLKEGEDIALVSDAGTPGISDPGYALIRLARDNGVPVTAVPGPTAAVAALTLSALPSDRFVFEGFLPVKKSARRKKLERIKHEERTVIFYESPHRLIKALADIEEVMGDPVIVCVRELTKKFEESLTDRASRIKAHFVKTRPRGEFVLLLNLKEA